LTHDVGRIFPQQWERFASVARDPDQRLRLPEVYGTLLFSNDESVREHAARQWCAWEDAHVSLTPGSAPSARFNDPEFRLLFARLVTHYWAHAAFLDDGQLIDNVARLNGIPGFLIHGRYDVSSPLETAWQLHKRWRTSELHVIDDAGHGGGGLTERIISLTNRIANT
jgi:proline iminopeptidase